MLPDSIWIDQTGCSSFQLLGRSLTQVPVIETRLPTGSARWPGCKGESPPSPRRRRCSLGRRASCSRVERAAAAGPLRGTLIHGDFKPSQLLLVGNGVAVVDLDRAGTGHPALDVRNFMAQFHKDALRPGQESLRALAERFHAEYLRRAGPCAAPECARLGLSLALVRMALRRFERNPYSLARGGPASRAAKLLDEAGACLT